MWVFPAAFSRRPTTPRGRFPATAPTFSVLAVLPCSPVRRSTSQLCPVGQAASGLGLDAPLTTPAPKNAPLKIVQGGLKCIDGGVLPGTLVEFKIGSSGNGNKDFYDVSLVDGYNVGIGVRALSPNYQNLESLSPLRKFGIPLSAQI
ncbi:hypothetical protein VIGAN_01389100 [Vigna angularis var. angularis]|uniref:Uncharacterized protein n=1 Tax=Vigna angularis var. angularis TaxID=157739 RepID=A0A0S3R5X3_PHAAN|nr:hypothetical protein VIGAN_01389100 [Vigna angularis var. angularis]